MGCVKGGECAGDPEIDQTGVCVSVCVQNPGRDQTGECVPVTRKEITPESVCQRPVSE